MVHNEIYSFRKYGVSIFAGLFLVSVMFLLFTPENSSAQVTLTLDAGSFSVTPAQAPHPPETTTTSTTMT